MVRQLYLNTILKFIASFKIQRVSRDHIGVLHYIYDRVSG